MAKLFNVFLFMLEEQLLPHVLWWVNQDQRILRLRFFHLGKREINETWCTVFKVLDSFNERKKEEYSKDKKYKSNSKYRCRANIRKFIENKELIENPDVIDDQNQAKVREFIVNSGYDISHGISTLTEEEKNGIRCMVAEDYQSWALAEKRVLPDPSPGTSYNEVDEDNKSWALAEKRALPDPSPGTSCNKKFKSSSSTVDLPSNLTQELSTQPSPNSVIHNPSGGTNVIIIINVLTTSEPPRESEKAENVIENESTLININVLTTPEPAKECEMAEEVLNNNDGISANVCMEVLPTLRPSNLNETVEASNSDIILDSYNYARNDVSFNPNDESLYPPMEESRTLRSPTSCVQNNISLYEAGEKDCGVDGQNQGLLNESCFWGNKEESNDIGGLLVEEATKTLLEKKEPDLDENFLHFLDEEQGTPLIPDKPDPYTELLNEFNMHVGDD